MISKWLLLVGADYLLVHERVFVLVALALLFLPRAQLIGKYKSRQGALAPTTLQRKAPIKHTINQVKHLLYIDRTPSAVEQKL